MARDDRRAFFPHLDEFHAFTTLSLAGMLAELRKYRVGLTMAHKYMGQLDEKVRDAILGNTGTIIGFRMGVPDAKVLVGEFHGMFAVEELLALPNHGIYIRLMVNGAVTRPFSAHTILLKNRT